MNEKEAIEVLKNMNIEISGTSECKKCIFSDEERCFRDGKDCQMIAIETVLNLIEKQQAEIEDCKKCVLRDEVHNYIEELEKKDKIIDLMASAICYEPLPTDEFCISRNLECPVVGGNRDCKDCVKQYFNPKIEKGE